MFPYDVVDVLLYRVELAVQFTNAYGDIDERFYTSTGTAYEDALKRIVASQLQPDFRQRCSSINQAAQGIGWGFSDQMDALTEQYLT